MIELGRVMANEWMKLVHRWRLWIAILLGILMVGGLSTLSYLSYQDQLSFRSPENRIQQMEERLSRLKNQPENPKDEAGEAMLDRRINELKTQIEKTKERVKRNQVLANGDWKPVVQDQIQELKKQLQHAQSEGNESAEGNIQGQLMTLQYQLSHGIRPQLVYEKSAYDEMSSLLGLISIVFLPMLIVILTADMVSGETTTGAVKLLLIRPVSRMKILLGKWLVTLGASAFLVLCLGLVMWVLNLALYGTGGAGQPEIVGVNYTFEMVHMDEIGRSIQRAIPHYGEAMIIPRWQFVLAGIFLTTLAMMAVATITFLCSTLFKSAMVSTGVAFALVIIGEIMGQMVHSGKWVFWLFSVHLNLLSNWSGDLSRSYEMSLPLWFGLATLGIWSLAALVISLVYFKRKDVLNA